MLLARRVGCVKILFLSFGSFSFCESFDLVGGLCESLGGSFELMCGSFELTCGSMQSTLDKRPRPRRLRIARSQMQMMMLKSVLGVCAAMFRSRWWRV